MTPGAPPSAGAPSRSAHALRVLEFQRVLDAVAVRAVTPSGAERVASLRPDVDPVRVRLALAEVEETSALLEARSEWSPQSFLDARRSLKTLATDGAVLTPEDVLVLLSVLRAARNLSTELEAWVESPGVRGRGGSSSSLGEILRVLPSDPALERDLERVVDDGGEVRDGASRALETIRRKLRAKRSEVVRSLESYMRELPEAIRVEDASVSIRDGSFVVPIRREGRGSVGGVVRGESGSGATLFVEPPIGLRLAGEIHALERDEAAEVQRVLREATERARASLPSLERGSEALVTFDSLYARARAARAWGASVPELLDAGAGGMSIVRGRHPLLIELGADVVPFDLEMGERERVVVVSGPNTGGKTVLLKAVGLIHMLAQSGVVPPVGPGTRIAVMRAFYADIGDEQSIAASLSTFSAHMESARTILAGADRASLVLFDEMGTGTDPMEGAALARAILEVLVEVGATVLVTSHLGELKRLDEDREAIVNASLVFDVERMEPTFRLQMRRPGRSFGLLVARRLGIPERVLERAEAYVGTDAVEMDRLLADLQEKERALAEALERAELAGEQARALRSEAEGAGERLAARERSFEREARERARQLLLEARGEVEAALDEVRAGERDLDPEAETRVRRRIEEAAEEQRRQMPAEKGTRPGPAPPSLAPGTPVRVGEASTAGVVREVDGDRVTVEVGGLRLRVPTESVMLAPGARRSPTTTNTATAAVAWEGIDLEPRHEIDLRGHRVDEVELELGRALDGAVVGGLSELRIIHGKGTGAVKARVRALLDEDPRVDAFRPGGEGEGGEGVTVASLR